jgi:hypothetical protein
MDRTNFEPGVLQVEVPLDAVHDVVADRTLVDEPEHQAAEHQLPPDVRG